MNGQTLASLVLSMAGIASAFAQPSITSLGSGVPLGVTDSVGGSIYVGGSGLGTSAAARWTLSGGTITGVEIGGNGGGYISLDGLFQVSTLPNVVPTIVGNTATSVTPAFNPNPTLSPAVNQPATTEFAGRRWSSTSMTWQSMGGLPIVPGLIAYGSSSSGSSTGSFLTPNGISSTGRFSVGLAYVCTYNNAGNAVSANTFRWRPFIWDADANGGAGEMTVLPTPFKTTAGQTSLRRTGNAYAVSSNGLVVAGATEHNVSTTPGPDADGGRLAVWMRPSLTDPFVMTYLDTGVDGSGFPKYITTTPGSMVMNAAGTIIAARGPDGVTKWTWNGSSWGAPTVIGSSLAAPASWLPVAVTSCGLPPNIGGTLAMSEDGNTIVGSVVYSTCGSFMSGGFIWTSGDGVMQDWYDYHVDAGTPGVEPNGFYGPVGDQGDPTRGLPRLGYPTGISPDGTSVVGFQGGTQRIPGAVPWIIRLNGGTSCVAPSITNHPAALVDISACSSSIILSVAGAGTAPLSFQWYKDGNPLSDGLTAGGSTITGATSFQLRVNPPLTSFDTGTYHAVITGQCSPAATSGNAVVRIDPAFPAASNDLCSSAEPVVQGTNVLTPAQSPCSAYIWDTLNYFSCPTTQPKADRWYVFTPTTSGNYRLDTCGANYDTVLSVFDSCGGNELACNNDYNTGPSTGCTSSRSRISSLPMTMNVPYYIRIAAPSAAFLSNTSTMNLSINPAPPLPPNDACTSATPAVIGANPFNTTEATNDGFVASACSSGSSASRDVWFSYTPLEPGKLTLSTCPQGTAPTGYSLMANTVLSVHSSPCGPDLVCNDNLSPVPTGCGTSLSTISRYPIQESNTIWIRVAGNSSTTFGAGQLNLTLFCVADVDDGSGTGAPDGGVTIEDLLYYLALFDMGVAAADLDNGTMTGTPDGGVTIEDLLFFLQRFDIGC